MVQNSSSAANPFVHGGNERLSALARVAALQKQLRQRYDEKRMNKKYAKQFETNHRIIVRNLE